MSKMADWTYLPNDLLTFILEKFNVINDVVCFRAVCKSWRQVEIETHLPPKSPWLMLSDHKEEEDPRILYNPWTQNCIKLQMPKTYTYGRKCLSLSFGWLLNFGPNFKLQLVNPFLRSHIALPPLSQLPIEAAPYLANMPLEDYYGALVQKAALSSDPWNQSQGSINQDCILMIICGENRTLAFTRLGDNIWHKVDILFPAFFDVAYCRGTFYVVGSWDAIIPCFISDSNNAEYSLIIPTQLPNPGLDQVAEIYLAESCGDLLLVSRTRDGWSEDDFDERIYPTTEFQVFKFEEYEDEETNDVIYQWVEVKSLDDRILFIGQNASTSLSASDCNSNYLEANCIYFTEDQCELLENLSGERDTGVFNMETRSIDYWKDKALTSVSRPPFWYI